MDFKLPSEVEAFRQEVREFIFKEWPEDRRRGAYAYSEETYSQEREFRRKLGEKGWLALSWPVEYGGSGRPFWEQFVFYQEMSYHGAPAGGTGVNLVGPVIMRVGTDDQKARFLPRIAQGDIDLALGYTEPDSGTDLASLQTRAVRDGDDYVINGTKRFTSAAHRAEYVWLATRTDPDAPKHRGISMFLVDLKSPGITIRPLWTMGDGRTNEMYLDNVRVPRENLIGEENRGWYYAAAALDFERISVFPVASLRSTFDKLVDYIRTASFDGHRLKDDPDVRRKIARISTELEVAQMLSLRAAWIVSQGMIPNYEASMLKVFGTELQQRMTHAATLILGLYGQLQDGSPDAVLEGRFERAYRAAVMPTFGAGSNEIQRNIIATRGMGLPRS